MHIGLGASILDNLSVLPAGLAILLARHRSAFLFGNIAADVVFAKRLSRVKQFCHHWSTAFEMLEVSRNDATKSFAYGYLSHLAADTVAHGKYVPRQILMSRCSVNFGHLHWELRADATEADATHRLLAEVIAQVHAEPHEVLARHMTGTFLPFDLNRLLFHRMNKLAVTWEFRRTMATWNRCSRWYLPETLLHGYRAECIDRIQSILEAGCHSALVREDPNGTSALMQLRVRRREVRRLRRHGIPIERRMQESSRGFEPIPTLSRTET